MDTIMRMQKTLKHQDALQTIVMKVMSQCKKKSLSSFKQFCCFFLSVIVFWSLYLWVCFSQSCCSFSLVLCSWSNTIREKTLGVHTFN